MTVVHPNAVSGINSITVQTGNSLSIHKADGSLLRTITGSTGVTTFATASVGTAWTDFSQGGGLNIGLGASISNGSGNVLTFGTNGDDRVRITSAGKVGINQTSPEGLLHIEAGSSGASYTANAADTLILERDGACLIDIRTTAAVEGGIVFSDNSARAVGRILCDHSDNAITFGTNGSEEHVRITSGGLVGINTDTIGTNHNLEIFGNASAYAVLNVKSQSLSHGATLELGAQDDDNYGSITQFASGASEGGRMKFVAGTTETMNLRGGQVLVGTTADVAGGSVNSKIQVRSTSYDASLSIIANRSNSGGGNIAFTKTRGTGQGDVTVVQDDDNLGGIYWYAADGTDTNCFGADITAYVDGTPGGNDTPGRLVFSTTADGDASATERMRITSDGQIGLNKSSPKAWNTSYTSLQIQDAGYIAGSNDDSFVALGANNYLDTGGTYDYANSDFASQLYQVDGTLVFRNAPSGTADNAITWTDRLSINASGNATFAGTIDDSKGDVRDIPNVSKTSAYTLVATDGGKAIHITTGGVTVPNATFAGGEAVTIVNSSNSNQTITQGSSLTMYLGGDAGTTGNRTLAGRGVATVWFHNGSTAYISGSGLS